MAYGRTRWTDHVVSQPRTFIEVENEDGSVTHTPAGGETYQQGTPKSADNFNNIEAALQDVSVAFDWMYCIMQAREMEMQAMREKLSELTGT